MIAKLYEIELLQDKNEFDSYLDLLRQEGVRSYLEIGSANGGSLWRAANVMPRDSVVVSVSLIKPEVGQTDESITRCIADLTDRGYTARWIYMNSRDPMAVAKAQQFAPYDCVFIDGDHSIEGVTADWENYGNMGRMVAFHDIAWNPTWKSKAAWKQPVEFGVPKLWEQLKSDHKHVEFKLRGPAQNYYGIGVLWH